MKAVEELAEKVGEINDEVEDLKDKAITEDVYYINDRKIVVKEDYENMLYRFCIDEYESLDFLAVVTTSPGNYDDHNDLKLNLL